MAASNRIAVSEERRIGRVAHDDDFSQWCSCGPYGRLEDGMAHNVVWGMGRE